MRSMNVISHLKILFSALLVTGLFLLGCGEQEPPASYDLTAADFAGIDWLTVDVDSLQQAWRTCCPDKFEAVWPSQPHDSRRIDEAPHLLSMPDTHFPLKARAMEATGMVQVNILVGADSTVWAATVQRGSRIKLGFEEEALKAALASKWTPAIRAGQPAWTWVSYPFHFSDN